MPHNSSGSALLAKTKSIFSFLFGAFIIRYWKLKYFNLLDVKKAIAYLVYVAQQAGTL